MVTVYGIKNCDTVKKARVWLDKHHIGYTFHDFRNDGLDVKLLQLWCNKLGWEILLNRRSRSWKDLPEGERAGIDEANAVRLMSVNPTLIKRPVVVFGEMVHAGFDEKEFDVLFGHLISKEVQGM